MSKNNPTGRQDPIRENYYRPLEIADDFSDWAFYAGAILSIVILVVEKVTHPTLYQWLQIAFVLIVVGFFLTGIVTRLYFFPRAEDARRSEFLSNVFGVELTYERTQGYYNNDETDPYKRLSLCVLENSFFSKSILRKMVARERIKVAVYFFLFLVVILWRETPGDWLVASAQVLFSEVIFSKWLRLEWLRNRAENIYQSTYQLIQSQPKADRLQVYALDAFGRYETGKTLCSILQSKDFFEQLNPTLTAEWERVKQGLI
ncbi:hypothetical protein ACO0K3_10710 [Undibacterium sp. Rencai35W]|uniref:hypothetical protein n=1 Tax=Undibacterium sp. Rencai35W TaxID=3413046 RepID=UPI003BF16096